jgi:hypothetical protein
MEMNLLGFCSSEHNKFDIDFYSQKQKKIYLTLPMNEQEKVIRAWGNLKPPIYEDRIIINVSRHQDFSNILDKWGTYHIKVQFYKSDKFASKKAVLMFISH